MRKEWKRGTALMLVAASAVIAGGAGNSPAVQAAKKPKLSAKTATVYIGRTKKLTVKKNGVKRIAGTSWTTKNKKVIALSSKKRDSVRIKAKKKGNAVIKAVIRYEVKGSKKLRKTTIQCKIKAAPYVSPEKAKKSNVEAATTKYQPLAKLAEKHGFKLGTVTNFDKTFREDYFKLATYHFNSLTASNEFKAYSLLNQMESAKNPNGMPVMDYTKADQIISKAREKGIKMRGHVLVWHAFMSDWFFREGYENNGKYVSKEMMQKRLQYYIEQVITHFETKYPGTIYCWDVVNEAVADNAAEALKDDKRNLRVKNNKFYDVLGPDYVEQSFLYAKDTIEKLGVDVKLYYNDYNAFFANKRDAILNLVSSVNSYAKDASGNNRKLCDGVGMQGYIGGYGTQTGCLSAGSIELIREAIQKYAALGMEVQVTEMAVRNYVNTNSMRKKHADFYGKLFKMFTEVNAGAQKPLTAVCIWGLVDDPTLARSSYEYSMNGPYCGLFSELYAVNGAFKKVYEVLK